MTRTEALAQARRRLVEAHIDGAALDARLLALEAFRIEAIELARAPEATVTDADVATLEALIARRIAGEPVSRILGVREFYGLPFRLSQATLSPRPETETLVDEALRVFAEKDAAPRILDLGTGAGCILLSLLHERPHATGVGVDLSHEAARAARANAVHLGLERRAQFIVGDWAASLTGNFDLVLSNPPYIPKRDIETLSPEVARHDPRLALDGGDDGLDAYRMIFADVRRMTRPGSVALLEIGHDQAAPLRRLAAAFGLPTPGILQDLSGKDRVVVIRP